MGVFTSEDPSYITEIIAVADVGGLLLVAIPEAAWHRKRAKRNMAPDALTKVVQVVVPVVDNSDRNTPLGGPSLKIWLGLLKGDFEDRVAYGQAEEACQGAFPRDSLGLPRLPLASALIAIAKDHFEVFYTGESGQAPPPGLGDGGDPHGLAERIAALEAELAAAKSQLGGAARKSALKKPAYVAPTPKRTSRRAGDLPEGVDPGVAAQALQAGVSPEALREMAAVLQLAQKAVPPTALPVEQSSEEELDGALPAVGGGGSGSLDPVSQALVQLTNIVQLMHEEKKVRKDKGIENILDRAESGSSKDGTGSHRSKASALRSLQLLLTQDPKMIYTALEKRLSEDWELATAQPGVHVASTSARGWSEHRSRVQSYPSTIRASWIVAGIWDALKSGRPEEGRARAALGLAMLDQQSCDAGSWLVAGEISLEPPPPYHSFSSHAPPSTWESPHTSYRRPLVRPHHFEVEGSGGVSGEESKDQCHGEDKVGGRWQCSSCGPKRKSKSKSRAEGKRKGKGGSARGAFQSMMHDDEMGFESGRPGRIPGDSKPSSTAAIHVPGSSAPTMNLNSLWSAMPRWILRSGCTFATFLHSFLRNSPNVKLGTVDYIWPISAPYPAVFYRGEKTAEKKHEHRQSLQKAVNLAVLSLSWLHLHRPQVCPSELSLGTKLSAKQWQVVRFLEEQIAEVSIGDVGPAEMGRTAARVENLESFLEELHARVEEFLPQNYCEGFVSKAVSGSRPLRTGHTKGDPGVVVGQMKSGVPVQAKAVDAQRLSFPKTAPEFDPTPLFPEPHRQVYVDPVSMAREPDPSRDRPPRVRMLGSKKQTQGLLSFLDEHQRLRLVPAHKIRKTHLCGAFSLVKDESKDRLILDARPPNELESTLKSWCKTLGSIQSLSQMELPPDCNMIFSGTDLRDYYYCFRVSRARSRRNTFAYPMTPTQAQYFRCFDDSLWAYDIVYPCLSTLAMGDCQAVELGQLAHVKLGLISRAFSPFELLSVHGRAPRSSLAAGIVIDDAIFAEAVPKEKQPNQLPESERRLNLLLEEYLQRGLTAHPKKTFKSELQADFWGARCDGLTGRLRANPRRLVPLVDITCQVARLKFATMGLLEVLCGAWVSVLQVRRRLLCLLDELYSAQRGRERTDIISLSAPLVSELWLLVLLGPLACADLRAQSLPEVYFTDASDWGTAAVKAKIPLHFARELPRHCLSRGNWSKLLSPWQSWLKEHEMLFPAEDEAPDGVPLVSHPLWTELAETLPCTLVQRKESRQRHHINVLELKSVLELEKKLSYRYHRVRYLLGADSQVGLSCLCKGRSSSPILNEMLQSSLGIYLGAGLNGNYGFVPSNANPSDDPTRNRPLRAPSKNVPSWWHSMLVGDFREFDDWLSSIDFDPLVLAELPFTPEKEVSVSALKSELLDRLRDVQKRERLELFDQKFGKRVESVSPLVDSENSKGTKKKSIKSLMTKPRVLKRANKNRKWRGHTIILLLQKKG